MLNKIIGLIAAAVAERVAAEVARQIPSLVATVVDGLSDRLGEMLPDLSDLDDLVAKIARQVISELGKKLPFPFR